MNKFIGYFKDLIFWLLTASFGNQTYQRLVLRSKIKKYQQKLVFEMAPCYPWRMPLFQRPQQMALSLARLQFPFIYYTASPRKDYLFCSRSVEPRLFLSKIQYRPRLDKPRVVYQFATNHKLLWQDIETEIKLGNLVLYEYLDEISQDLACQEIGEEVFERHRRVLADERIFVVVTAQRLYAEVAKYRSKNFILVSNGVDSSNFSQEKLFGNQNNLLLWRKKDRPIIGYFGALASWFDYSLIKFLATERPGWDILLLGFDYDGSLKKSGLSELSNVHVMGPIPYKSLPHYAKYFDVATIPFLLNEITLSTNPIKLFEYMALGRPIVTTNLPECRKYRSAQIAHTHEEFVQLIDVSLEIKKHDHCYLETLKEEAYQNSWDHKAQELVDGIYQTEWYQKNFQIEGVSSKLSFSPVDA